MGRMPMSKLDDSAPSSSRLVAKLALLSIFGWFIPLMAPVVCIYCIYEGRKLYLFKNRATEKIGLLFLLVGLFFALYSYFVITGYFSTPHFDSENVRSSIFTHSLIV